MNSNGTAENAWRQYHPHHNPQEQHHKQSHNQHHHPSLWESRQDTQRCYHIGPYHRDKVQENEEHCQQSCIGDMQQREQNACTQGTNQRKQQRPPKIPAQALIEGVQQEGDGAPGGCRSFEAEPANDTRAVNDKVDTERDHNNEVEDVPEQPGQERKQPWEGA